MTRFTLFICGFLALSSLSMADEKATTQDIKLTYKAYWGGFVVSKVYSHGVITPDSYQVDVSYEVTGLAAIFSSMKNKVSARGKFAADGSVRPLSFDNQGSWRHYGFSNHTEFRLKDSKIISHEYQVNFKRKVKYIPVREALRYGPDMVSFYLGLTLDEQKMKIGAEEKHQNIFGGFFLLDISYRCTGNTILNSKRSVYKAVALVCVFHDKIVGGGFERIKKKKSRKRRSRKKKNTDTMEPVPLQVWYGKIDGVERMVPVYSEFPFGWGKIRVYLSEIEVTNR